MLSKEESQDYTFECVYWFQAFLLFLVVWPFAGMSSCLDIFDGIDVITVDTNHTVYYPLAHWIWNGKGWLKDLGVLDFAGGMVIHTSSGVAGEW